MNPAVNNFITDVIPRGHTEFFKNNLPFHPDTPSLGLDTLGTLPSYERWAWKRLSVPTQPFQDAQPPMAAKPLPWDGGAFARQQSECR